MFGKKQVSLILDSARQDREMYEKQASEDRQMMAKQLMILSGHLNEQEEVKTEQTDVTEADKLRAAYALNLCTVSISQIIAYNDLVVMEQEYDAIINNLNLEKIIKDDALLNTLKVILDTITYFRIDHMERQFIDKQYQQKLKNAIWQAVPNISVIFTGNSSPVSMALALASQIGTGYMNYRRAKSEAQEEKDAKLWKLQETAVEQFNGLRRELFSAAWKLADRYDFPDQYRLTERQIDQYNRILMDTNTVRKYERLLDIRDNFEAYPYFWYYLGHAANAVSFTPGISEEMKQDYRQKAREHFAHFEEKDTFSVLREDMIAASCYLEYVDLLNPIGDAQKIRQLLDKAQAKCGKANDVLQICATSYLRIGDYVSAEKIMRHLVVEDYNRKINAQLLSTIYVGEAMAGGHSEAGQTARANYESLSLVIAPHREYLIPYPSSSDAKKNRHLIEDYLEQQKQELKSYWMKILEAESDQYEVEFYRCFPTLKEHEDEYFGHDNFEIRKEDFIKFMNKDAYLYVSMLKDEEFPDNIVTVMKRLYMSVVKGISLTKEQQSQLFSYLSAELYSDNMKELTDMIYDESWEKRTFEFKDMIMRVDFRTMTDDFFELLKSYVSGIVDAIDNFSLLAASETRADTYCTDNQLHVSKFDHLGLVEYTQEDQNFVSLVAGSVESTARKCFEKSLGFMREMGEKLIRNQEKTRLVFFDLANKGEADEYWIRTERLRSHTNIYRKDVFAVLDNVDNDHDLIFALEGVYRIRSFMGLRKLQLTTYADFASGKVHIDEYYKNDSINLSRLKDIIEGLEKINLDAEKEEDPDDLG